MNNLIFGDYPYKKFSNTFLTKVLIVFRFDPLAQPEGFDERMDKFSMESFGIPGPKEMTDTLQLSSTDGKIVFYFSVDFVSVEIAGDIYDSFSNSIIPQAFKLKSFVKDVIGQERIKTISIRKLNIWQFENKKKAEVIDVESIRNYVFTDHFNQLNMNVDLSDDEKNIDYFKKHRWSEDGNVLELRTAFVEMDNSSKEKHIYGLILDSERMVEEPNGITCEDIESVLKSIDMDLYNAYMWCVSDSIKNIMNTGKEGQ